MGILKPLEKGHKKLGGRKKGTPNMGTTLRKYLKVSIEYKNAVTKKKEKRATRDFITLALIAKALGGSLHAIDMIYNRIDGKDVENINAMISMKAPKEMTLEELQSARNAK